MNETKKRILETANTLFQERGYKDVKIRDICEACNTSIGNFYHHFISKEAIYTVAHENADELLEQEFLEQNFDNYFDAILFILKRQIYHLEKYGLFAVKIGCRKQITGAERYTVRKNRFIYTKYKELIISGVESGEFTATVDVNDIVEWILRTVRGCIYDWCIYEGSYHLSGQVTRDVTLLLSALLLNKIEVLDNDFRPMI